MGSRLQGEIWPFPACSQPHASSLLLVLIQLLTSATQPQTNMASRRHLTQLTAELRITDADVNQRSSPTSTVLITKGCIWNVFPMRTCIAVFSNSEAPRPLPPLLSTIQSVHPGTEGSSLASSAVDFPTVVPARHFWRTLTGDSGIKSQSKAGAAAWLFFLP